MKKFKLLLFIFSLLSISFQSKSQDINAVNWSGELDKIGGMLSSFHILGLVDDHYFFTQSHPKKKNLLFKYDLNHELVSKKDINLKNGDKNIIIEELIHTKNKIIGVDKHYDRKTDKSKCFVTEFKNGTFSKPKIYPIHGISDVSQNGEYVLSYSDLSKKEELENHLSFTLFDADMKLIWKKSFKNEFDFSKYETEQTLINNKGQIFIFAKEEIEIKKELSYNVFHLFHIEVV